MNKKERIIELVKQNIITIDEALDLLEAGDIEPDQFITTDMEETSFDVESTETDEDTTEDNSVTSYFDDYAKPVSYTHLTLPTILRSCRSRWSPYH